MTAASELTAPAVDDRPVDRRWLALCIIALVQLMIVVDGSIVTVALPSMQEDLNISGADRQWVVTAYTLAFGGLLLLGGRIADYVGRKRMFVFGLIGFAVASGVGGLAQNPAALRCSRRPGRLRRPHGPGRFEPAHGHLPRAEGARTSVRRVLSRAACVTPPSRQAWPSCRSRSASSRRPA